MKKVNMLCFSKTVVIVILLSFCYIVPTSAQIKSIAVINDVEDSLYLMKEGFMENFKDSPYNCECKQSVIAAKYMMELLNKNYKAELIDLPAEYRESRGVLTKGSRKWLKSLNGKYDAIIFLYTRTKNNGPLFRYNDYPLYSSGLVYITRDPKTAQVYTSVTARAFSTKDGLPFYHLDNYTANAIIEPLKNITPITSINDPQACATVNQIIHSLIRFRYNEFIEGFDFLMKEE